MNDKAIGHQIFTDGITRPVYNDDRGQFVLVDGMPVYGVWLPIKDDTADSPVFVHAGQPIRKESK